MINRPYITALLMFVCVFLLNACAMHRLPSNIDSPKGKVLVVNSNSSIDRYQRAQTVFTDDLQHTNLSLINLENESQPVEILQDVLNKNAFDVIYCIGAKALGSIEYIYPETPVVYSSVLNWRRFRDHKNYFGISSELSSEVQLTWLKYFFKDLNNIGVLYSEENQTLIDDALAISNNLNINLKPIKLHAQEQLLTSAEKLLPELDALWLISDVNVLSSADNVKNLFKLAEKMKVPVLTYNPLFIDLGAVLSLGVDLPTTARQAAIITTKILEKQTPRETIQFPAGSKIILGRDALKRSGLKLNPGVLGSVDEIR